ncbi:MAG TPA: DUF420 domain-containing protein [Limnochordia bacterium]|nr:DUF420 domain-containing protein [Limnochordia bacterium]
MEVTRLATTAGGFVSVLPALDTAFIVTSGLLVMFGYTMIKLRKRRAHMVGMLGASFFAALFLITYLVRSALAPPTPFPGQGGARVFYLSLLTVHSILATILPIMVILAVLNALRRRFARHRRIGRVTVPMWIFVAGSGWVIYAMLYTVRWPS